MAELPTAIAAPRRRSLGIEVAFVVLVSAAVLVPGIWRYSLVDPWETHYGEVARMMLQDHDWVHTDWPQDGEGFRSKPVLTFWLMAGGMRALGVAADGGYSGELEHDARTMIAIRLPFILTAIAGLTLMWWMLARLVNRRLAWLALLVVGTCPFFCLVARQAIPDMPLVASVMGAVAMFVMAVEDGDRPIAPFGTIRLGRRRLALDARHVLLLIAGGFVVLQAAYYAYYFTVSPVLAGRLRVPLPSVALPALMVLMLGGLSRDGWLILRMPWILLGGVIAEIRGSPPVSRAAGESWWRYGFDKVIAPWERHALDRYLVRALGYPFAWANGGGWASTSAIADRVLGMRPLATMRQVYLLWCYALLGVSVLAKGPPGLAVVGGIGVFYVLLLGRWRALYDGGFELKRGLLLLIVTFLPWHLAMWLKDGNRFIDEYLFTHILNRAAVGVDNSPGTFEYYTSQLGHGMWLWAALLPAAISAALLRARTDTREGRVRFLIALWAIVGVAFFSLVQTKFHHYILPAVPALAILVAFFLDDMLDGRERLHPLYAALGIGIVLLVCRDLMFEPERWIEMFVFRYDRPWPAGEPWHVDASDGFLGLGVLATIALATAGTRWVRAGVGALCAAGLAICLWAQLVYMPVAGKHWGMGDAIHRYYAQRSIYGAKVVYFGAAELLDDWREPPPRWRFQTFVPDTLQLGQPMTLTIEVHKAADERLMESTVTLVGTAAAIGDHEVELVFAPNETTKLVPMIKEAERRVADFDRQQGIYNAADEATRAAGKLKPPDPLRGRPPVHAVDADRLIAWQLYWRGENFWSGDEIWGWLPEMKTAFVKTDSVEFLKYLNDHSRAPLGRRYFLVTEAGRALSVRATLPTPRARDTFEVIDTSSNKFTLVAFYL